MVRDDDCWRGTAVTEEAHQGKADRAKILCRNSEGQSCTGNLFNEVHYFLWVEVHEPVYISYCRTKGRNDLLVNLILRSMGSVWWKCRISLLGTTKECAEVFVEMGQEETGVISRGEVDGWNGHAYYCLEPLLLAARPFMRGAAPPSSRKLTETPILPPVLVEERPPLKYGRRLTILPLTTPGDRMPGTAMPVLVTLSARISLGIDIMKERHTVSNHSSIDNSSKKLELVLRSVISKQSNGVLIAEGYGILGSHGANRDQEGE